MDPSWPQLVPPCPFVIYAMQEPFQDPSPQLPGSGIDRPNGMALLWQARAALSLSFLWLLIS